MAQISICLVMFALLASGCDSKADVGILPDAAQHGDRGAPPQEQGSFHLDGLQIDLSTPDTKAADKSSTVGFGQVCPPACPSGMDCIGTSVGTGYFCTPVCCTLGNPDDGGMSNCLEGKVLDCPVTTPPSSCNMFVGGVPTSPVGHALYCGWNCTTTGVCPPGFVCVKDPTDLLGQSKFCTR